jgi:hypothetical protein
MSGEEESSLKHICVLLRFNQIWTKTYICVPQSIYWAALYVIERLLIIHTGQQCYSMHCCCILKAMFTTLLAPYGWSKVLSTAFSPNPEKRLSYSHSVFRTRLLELKKQILKSDHLRYSPLIHLRNNGSYYWHNTNNGIYNIEKHFFKRMSG